MRFIRDIINEKTQAASNGEMSALRYPLRLREEDRTDLVNEEPVMADPEVDEAVEAFEADMQDDYEEQSEHGRDFFADASEEDPEFDMETEEEDIDVTAVTNALSLSPEDEPAQSIGEHSHAAQLGMPSGHRESSTAHDPFSGLSSTRSDETEPEDWHIQSLVDSDKFDLATPSQPKQEENTPATVAETRTPEQILDRVQRASHSLPEPDAAPVMRSEPEPTLRREPAKPAHVASAPNASEDLAFGSSPQMPRSPAPTPAPEMAPLPSAVSAHKSTNGRGSKGRVKTRLLGFSAPQTAVQDPMSQSQEAAPAVPAQFPVGWLVVVDGPGKGASFSLFDGLTQIGRGEGQTVRLDFGDNTISRENHAAIAYDNEQRRFFFGHGGKANLVRLNGRPVLSTEDLAANSVIRIGETTLRFVALCGEDFSWGGAEMEDPAHARFG